jgi:acyl-coenzyme A synthetase/AMP-(fatty) acid ligase
VDEVAVIGVPGDLGDEDIKAFVVVNREVAPDALGDHMRAALASFKVPRYLEVVEALPHTETHRVAKNELSRGRTDREHDLHG